MTYSITITRAVVLFTTFASLVSLPLHSVYAAPINVVQVERSIEERAQRGGHNSTRRNMKERSLDYGGDIQLEERAYKIISPQSHSPSHRHARSFDNEEGIVVERAIEERAVTSAKNINHGGRHHKKRGFALPVGDSELEKRAGAPAQSVARGRHHRKARSVEGETQLEQRSPMGRRAVQLDTKGGKRVPKGGKDASHPGAKHSKKRSFMPPNDVELGKRTDKAGIKAARPSGRSPKRSI